MRKSILYLLLLLLVLPLTLSAKKKKVEVVAPKPVLTMDEQQHFDSLYFLAITQEQCHRMDSAMNLMQQAVNFYDSALMSHGYETGMQLNAPVDEEDTRPMGKPVSSVEAPGLAAALYFLSNQYRQQNNAVGAVMNIARATDIDSVNYWYNSAHADLMMALKRMEDAQAIYERLARLHPEKSEPLYALTDIYLRQDSTDQCLAVLSKIEELEGISMPLTEYKFFVLQKAGRVEEGFDEYRKLIKLHPYNVQYRLKLGDLQMQNTQVQQAKQTYDEAAAIEPDNAYVWVAQANYYSMTGNQAEADKLVADALVNANLDVDTKNTVMTEYLKGTYRKFAIYRERLKAGQTDVEPLDTLALLQKVDELFSTVTAQHPSAPEFYELQSEWFSTQRKDSIAAECIRFAVDLKPTNPDYWERWLYYSTSWLEKNQMIKRCDETLQQHPDMQAAYLIKAWAYIQMEQNDKAIEQYRAAIDHVTPPDANQISTLWGNIGDLYHQDHHDEEAYECYEKSLKYNPNNYAILNNYAYYLSQAQKELARAESMALKVIQKYPDNATYLDTYAWILYLEGSYVLADFYQQKAIDCVGTEDEGQSTLYDHFGDIKVKNNDIKAAVELWKKALQCTDCKDPEAIKKKISSAETLGF